MTRTGQVKYWTFAVLHVLVFFGIGIGALAISLRAYLLALAALTFGASAKAVTQWAGRRWLREHLPETAPLPEIEGDPWMTTALQGFIRAWEIEDAEGRRALLHLVTIARQRGRFEEMTGRPMTMGALDEMRGGVAGFTSTKAPIIT